MKKLLTTICFVFLSTFILLNSLVSQNSSDNPFTRSKVQNKRTDLGIKGAKQFLNLSQAFNNRVLMEKTESIQMTFPLTEKKNLKLALSEINILSQGFIIRDSKGNEFTPKHLGKFYKGSAEGYPESTVILNVFENEISGTLDLGERTYSLSKIKNSNEYILYEEKDLEQQAELACFTEKLKSKVIKEGEETGTRMPPNPDNCVKMYIELDHDLYNSFGNINDTYNYFAAAFSQVVVLYTNEEINITLNEVKVWDTEDPYTGPSTSNYLDQIMTELGTTFNGDLAHLVGTQGGGGIAYVDVLCNNAFGFGYSAIATSYNDVPVYSNTINILTHEIGHNLGSPHTHACSWNGNETQIDDCGNQVISNPGVCYDANNPIIPQEGGTIMSYCHLRSVGMDFNLGFGPQPGDLIRNRVYNASCLGPCQNCVDEGNACDDGDPCTTGDALDEYCNCVGTSLPDNDGDGVCSGADPDDDDICVPNSCNNCTVTTISIQVDNYPAETTWEIRNDAGELIASGAGYEASSTPQTRDICLEDGCYDFIINDQYGDGICCSFGNGSYTVSDSNGNVLASGGQFASSETTNFCYSNFTGCTDLDEDDICDDIDPCYDPMIMDMGEALESGTYNARQEIILNTGTTIPENAVIRLNAPSITIMDNTIIPASVSIEFNEVPCEN